MLPFQRAMSQQTRITMIPTAESLVRYDSPAVLSVSERKSLKSRPLRVSSEQNVGFNPVPPPQTQNRVSSHNRTEEILSAILPPRERVEGNQVWVQKVSSAPGTQADVLLLEEMLDMKLQELEAKETGICPVRRELYSQCFDELIRQVTVSCSERGLMLMRVRDEIQMTLASYETLYHSSLAFGMRKCVQAEQDLADLEERISTLENEKNELYKKLEEQEAKCDAIKRRETEKRQVEEDAHKGEIDFLKTINQQLKNQLEGILTYKK